jgi:hypothetical protein
MRLKQVWRPRICRLVSRSWELGGRRDRQRSEEGLGEIGAGAGEGLLYRLKTVLRSSKVSQYDQEVQLMRKGYVRFVWVEANETQTRFLFTDSVKLRTMSLPHFSFCFFTAFTELSSCHPSGHDNSEDAAIRA